MQPYSSPSYSWSPNPGEHPLDQPIDHGTMCSYDICLSAPRCTLVDHSLLGSRRAGGSMMDGFLSDAIVSYNLLLSLARDIDHNLPGVPNALVVNNSWGMFHPSWDFPPGHQSNYSHNSKHPFNRMVTQLERAGADILFAAGNCGADCPDSRCEGNVMQGITGANSHPSVLSVAGVSINGKRLGYSSQGPGALDPEKPDISSYSHFAGSGVYMADGGTSAACPVLAGLIAAIRRVIPAKSLSPAELRLAVRQSTSKAPNHTHDNNLGYGIIDTKLLLSSLGL